MNLKRVKVIVSIVALCFVSFHIKAQCPPNIDFENGTFDGWQLYTGNTVDAGGVNLINLTPVNSPQFGRHEIINSSTGNTTDQYGGFPTLCPNGSGNSIKLGNTDGGAQSEAASYTFTIPQGANQFSLTYYYAVVFQDPGHAGHQQPRLEIEVQNLTDGTIAGCSSFSFIASGGLPGFFQAPFSGNIPIWCKNWSANSINLDGNEGKTIRIFFKTADCTFQAHFGYAYIDVATECSSSFTGASYCPTDTSVTITAPFGYQGYKWFNQNFTQTLGTTQTLILNPPPPAGTVIKVELEPFAGYGCKDTLTANLVANLVVTADAGNNVTTCDNKPVQIGAPPQAGRVYSWLPTTGLSNPFISNPIATVNTTTTYTLTVRSIGGGCETTDQVTVTSPSFNNNIIVSGNTSICEGAVAYPILSVGVADSIQWYRNEVPLIGANATQYTVTQTGDYKAIQFSNTGGCFSVSATKHIDIFPQPIAGFKINQSLQCLPNNNFQFTDTSSVNSGVLQYLWDFGDGLTSTIANPTHVYTQPGVYNVVLKVQVGGGCEALSNLPVTVKPGAKAAFQIPKAICTNNIFLPVNNTNTNGINGINYLWDFGNGQTSTNAMPSVSYITPGNYNVKLTVTSVDCMVPNIAILPIEVEAQVPNTKYADQIAILNFPVTLTQRTIGKSVTWMPATQLNNSGIYKPVFKGASSQLYTINMTTAAGCVTVDTLQVNVIKKIAIYVPTAFTPNADGTNDYLKPLLYGFKKVQYFRVYNRLGQLLFQMNSDTPGWDGKVNGQLQERQTLVWVLAAEDVDGKMHQAKGTTILMR
ncbi:PKD domain-containing protein [Ferruginibacter yonginensis]|uniref:PKD domain-containing protein n=1 Tax=Ferruginibacter yonginensis TaxID=1310416 RepID=A0ABV8QU64_9BACT